jgi:putative transposase
MTRRCSPNPYAGYRYPPEIISHAVWLYVRFPRSLRMVDELLAARGIMRAEAFEAWRDARAAGRARHHGQGF